MSTQFDSKNLGSSDPAETDLIARRAGTKGQIQAHIPLTNPDLEPREPFIVPDQLRPRVELWKKVFTEYGIKDVVLYNGDHPELVYSQIEARGKFGADRKRLAQIEKANITTALKHLAAGHEPRNTRETRLAEKFAALPEGSEATLAHVGRKPEIEWQSGIKEVFERGLNAGKAYIPFIARTFDRAGIPIELAYLPAIESNFQNVASSPAGAVGMWQLMPDAARDHGLLMSPGIDERRDPYRSTVAAAQHLKEGYRKLGSWPLAITAYNHGVAGVMQRVKEGKSDEFHELIAPDSKAKFGVASQNYYPEFLAALEVAREKGITPGSLANQGVPAHREFKVTEEMPLEKLVALSGLSQSAFLRLNPAVTEAAMKGEAPIPVGYVARFAPQAPASRKRPGKP